MQPARNEAAQTASGNYDRMQGNKPVSILLIIIGFSAMFAVMWMTGRFGWSLQDSEGDRVASAVIHVLVDAAAAGLITASGLMLSWQGKRWKAMGIGAFVCALLLVAYSILSVYGFMSTRIAHLESHKSLVTMQQGDLDWKRSTSISRDVPRAERLFLRQEAKSAATDLKKTLSFVPDAAAASIASFFSTSIEKVQRFLVMVGSCAGQLIKVSCLFIGFSLWPHRLPVGWKPSGGNGGNGSKATEQPSGKPEATVASVPSVAAAKATVAQPGATIIDIRNPKSLSLEDRVCRYVAEQIAHGRAAASQAAIGRALGISKSPISRALDRLEAKGKVQRQPKGKFNEITVGRGGSGHALAAG